MVTKTVSEAGVREEADEGLEKGLVGSWDRELGMIELEMRPVAVLTLVELTPEVLPEEVPVPVPVPVPVLAPVVVRTLVVAGGGGGGGGLAPVVVRDPVVVTTGHC